jgi:hypothetical protein
MPLINTAVTVTYVAWDTSANTPKTGDVANHTLKVVADGTAATPAASPAEVDSTNAPGVYKVVIASGENTGNFMTLAGKSSTSNVSLIPVNWSNKVNAAQIDGSATSASNLQKSASTIIQGTVDDTGVSPTTTEFEADDITTAAADHYIGRIVIFTSGTLIGQATDITDYALSSGRGHFTVTALTSAPANNVTFVIV